MFYIQEMSHDLILNGRHDISLNILIVFIWNTNPALPVIPERDINKGVILWPFP